jgi:hypothetical protein
MPKPVIVSKPFEVTAGQIVDPSGELAKYGTQGADIPSAATVDLGAATGDFVRITGTTNISSFGVSPAGWERTVQFTGSLKLIYNSLNMILPAATYLQTAPNDVAIFRSRQRKLDLCFISGLQGSPIRLRRIGLGNVENIALSTWPGSANITGWHDASGVWQGWIAVNKGVQSERDCPGRSALRPGTK